MQNKIELKKKNVKKLWEPLSANGNFILIT